MFEDCAPFEVALALVQPDDLYLVLRVFDKRAKRQPEVRLRLIAEVYRIKVEI